MIVDLPIERLLDLPSAHAEGNFESNVSKEDIEAEMQGLGQLFHHKQDQPRVRKYRSVHGLGRGKISRLAHLINQFASDDRANNGDEVFSLLSSISLSEARKFHRRKYRKTETEQVQYRVLLVDDR